MPGQAYSFGVVKAAQARGDFDVLAERGRRLLRVHLPRDVDAGLQDARPGAGTGADLMNADYPLSRIAGEGAKRSEAGEGARERDVPHPPTPSARAPPSPAVRERA